MIVQINNLKIILNLYIFFSIIVILLAVFLFIYTRKYKQKKVRILGLFLDLSKVDCIVLSTNLLHLILSVYCVFNISDFNIMFFTMIAFNSIVSIILSFNLHLIIAEIIYTFITLLGLTLLNLVNTFLTKINYDTMTYILSLVFMGTIVVYLLFISVRKLEIVLKKNKYVRRNI